MVQAMCKRMCQMMKGMEMRESFVSKAAIVSENEKNPRRCLTCAANANVKDPTKRSTPSISPELTVA